MKKKTVSKKEISFEKANAAFEKLSPKEKRIIIAKDVIAQLESNSLEAVSGNVYLSAGIDSAMDMNPDVELRDHLNKQDSCTVCGIGSLFVCAVKRMDKLKIKDLNVDFLQTAIHKYLKDFFSKSQLMHIENAFEGHNQYDVHSDSVYNATCYFSNVENHIDDNEKLRLIMENIIKHDGTFKFSEKYRPVMKCILP